MHKRIEPVGGNARVSPADIESIIEVCLVDIALSVLNQAIETESHDRRPENQESSKSSRAHCDRE